jgi:hypothetical protein
MAHKSPVANLGNTVSSEGSFYSMALLPGWFHVAMWLLPDIAGCWRRAVMIRQVIFATREIAYE